MIPVQKMLSMSKQKNTTRRETAPPGVYDAKVVKVEIDNRYKDGAIIVTYELVGEKKSYTFKERFVINERFKRTREFSDYLDNLGIEDVEDYVGCREELDLKWNFSNTGRKELTVDNRVFLGFEDNEIEDSVAEKKKEASDA